MKLKEYKAKTILMMEQFENRAVIDPIDYYKLFDAIELRLLDLDMWYSFGLTEEDEIPAATKLIVPQF